MFTLRKWLKEKNSLRRKKQQKTTTSSQACSPPLFLPAQRPSNLTPSVSLDLTTSINNYGQFKLLPYEIRRSILVAAFGEQTMHMDLKHNKSSSISDTAIHSSWQWSGCVCQRRSEWTETEKELKLARKIKPCDDACFKGEGGRIGIMGWLLACRQAYSEGMDVLFATNTFHISGLDLMQHLSRLLPPRRLACITSLEMMWDFNPSAPPHGGSEDLLNPLWNAAPVDTIDSPLCALCRTVPDTFPLVRHLYISLQSWVAPGHRPGIGSAIEAMERVILGPIEAMIAVLGPGVDVSVAVQKSGWVILSNKYRDLYGPSLRSEIDEWHNGRFWKSLGPGDELGYWLCTGWNDMAFLGLGYGPMDIW